MYPKIFFLSSFKSFANLTLCTELQNKKTALLLFLKIFLKQFWMIRGEKCCYPHSLTNLHFSQLVIKILLKVVLLYFTNLMSLSHKFLFLFNSYFTECRNKALGSRRQSLKNVCSSCALCFLLLWKCCWTLVSPVTGVPTYLLFKLNFSHKLWNWLVCVETVVSTKMKEDGKMKFS